MERRNFTTNRTRPESGQGQRRSGGVTPRPSSGSAYPSPPVNDTPEYNENDRYGWNKDDMPGGRKLWIRLVIGFAFVSVLGGMFVTLGSVFFKTSHRMAMEESMSLPLVWCIIGIVSGSLMIIGSIILGKLIISDKWRKNQQPVYPSMAPPRVHFRVPTYPEEGEVEIEMPPAYDELEVHDPNSPPAVYSISGNISTNRLPYEPPPQYSVNDLDIPAVHSGINRSDGTDATLPDVNLPPYEEAIQAVPQLHENEVTTVSQNSPPENSEISGENSIQL